MEMHDPSEWKHRPELDHSRPARLFSYAQQKQEWLRRTVNEHQLPEAIDYLIDELEGFKVQTFPGESPLLNVVAQDVHYTRTIGGDGSRFIVETAPLPFPTNDDQNILGAHLLQGELFGFHRGDANDVRAYMTIGDQERRLMGGVYVPLLSVGIEHADIEFVQFSTSEKVEELGRYITEQLGQYDKVVGNAVRSVLTTLNQPNVPSAKKLHEISEIIPEVDRYKEVSNQFVDAILDMVCLKLDLYVPHDITTSSHRVVITDRPVRSYQAHGAASFENVKPELGLSGESANRWLGLFFINNDQAVQIPVQYITNIYKTQ